MTRHTLISVVWMLSFLVLKLAPIPAMGSEAPPQASVHGKYSNLIQTMTCPKDRRTYGEYREYGYWGGGAWCGQVGKAGYWVWVAPKWYVWSSSN